jgi:hypothetical protein
MTPDTDADSAEAEALPLGPAPTTDYPAGYTSPSGEYDSDSALDQVRIAAADTARIRKSCVLAGLVGSRRVLQVRLIPRRIRGAYEGSSGAAHLGRHIPRRIPRRIWSGAYDAPHTTAHTTGHLARFILQRLQRGIRRGSYYGSHHGAYNGAFGASYCSAYRAHTTAHMTRRAAHTAAHIQRRTRRGSSCSTYHGAYDAPHIREDRSTWYIETVFLISPGSTGLPGTSASLQVDILSSCLYWNP